MENILEVYQRPRDLKRPLVCLDEFAKQLLSETRQPQPVKPGSPAREDFEYVREGSATAFMIYAPLEGRREIFISDTATRTSMDYAQVLAFIAEELFADAEKIVLVEDNLNTHDNGSLYEAFAPDRARRLAKRFERHHTPAHGSWLNIAESEISAVLRTSIDDRVPSLAAFRDQCAAATQWRNDELITTSWQFTQDDARVKLNSLYPSHQK